MNQIHMQPADNRRHLPLVKVLWPSESGAYALLRGAFLIFAGSALLALSAKISVPLPYVPMTMQSLVVVMIGACYGRVLGTATLLAYLAEGALGLPVFAGPGAGLAYMMGPTGGFLIGFVAAAFVAGWLCERSWDTSITRLFAVMIAGHIIIFAPGFVWLAYGLHLGAEKAWLVGVLPFIAGSVVKSALGTALLFTTRRVAEQKRG